VEPGQLWEIPSVKTPGLVHRLLCGDALSQEDVARLLQGEDVRLAVTDPPYGVAVDHSWRDTTQGRTSPRGGGIMNDDRADWGEVYPLFGVEVVYVFHASNFASEVEAGLEREGYRVRQQIIWVKKSLTLSRAAYQWRHEPLFYAVREEAPRGRPVAWRMRRRGYEQAHGAVWYGVRKGSPAGWRGGRAQTTVWEFESPIHATAHNEGATLHPTEKPVECYEIPIRNHTLRGEAVTDPFGGSGTMIFAAERTGRRALVMEIDPRWVAVAIDRAQRQGLHPRLVERGDG
jgi:DNA modification methylase